MFCRFCGKEIPEGSVCDCQKQKEALPVNEVSGETAGDISGADVQQSDPGAAQAAVQPAAPAGDTVNVNIDLGGLKDIFIIGITRPVSVIEYALANAQKTPQFITGAIYAILTFLLPVIELNVMLGNYSEHFPVGKTAFLILLATVISRAVIALVPFAASLGQKNIKDLFAMVMAATAFPCVLRVILTVTFLIKWGPLVAIAAIISGCVCFVLDYEMIKTTTDKKNLAIWLFVLAELISGLAVYLICRGAIQDMSSSLMSF